MTLYAVFVHRDYHITLVSKPTTDYGETRIGGTISTGGFYQPGTWITVSANAFFGYEFVNWT
jgi:hypothetical protein